MNAKILSLFKRKDLNLLIEESKAETGLDKTLTRFNLITLGIGAVIGTGIFVLTGTAAALHAGPAITISFIISGLGCVFAGLCYTEFAAMIPISGSAYTYSYASLGEFMAWIIGWDLILEYLFASATVAVGWSGYVVSFLHDFGITIPPQFTGATGSVLVEVPGTGWKTISEQLTTHLSSTGININSLPHVTALFNLPAVLVVLVITGLLVVGIKESVTFNNFIVVLKLIVILLFIFFGMWYVNHDNWFPYIPQNTGTFGEFGWSGILTGSGVIFFAYIGFDAVSTAAQEAKNPQKDMPMGILGSLLICTILYIAVAAVLTGMVFYKDLNVSAPIAYAIDTVASGLYWLKPLIKIGAIAGLSSVILVLLMGQPRIFFSMSKDGLLPPSFSRIHKRFHTPHITTILTGIVCAIVAGIFPIDVLGKLVSIGTLFAFVIVCVSIIILRKAHPEAPRPFKTPWVPLVPILGAVICLVQMLALPLDTWVRLLIWMGMGMVIYFTYSVNHSKLRNKNK
jgi:APA family basic amino acid/polyamine antiporter